MTLSSISDFLHRVGAMGVTVFGDRISPSDWQILLALGRSSGESLTPSSQAGEADHSGAQSYKALKCSCGLSDDALSRGLRRLVDLGLVERRHGVKDLRVICYSLSPQARHGFQQMGRLVLMELSSLILGMTESAPPSVPAADLANEEGVR